MRCVRRDRAQLTEEHQTRAEKSDDARIATLSHDGIDDGGNCASEQGGQAAHADVGHLVLDIRVADVFELELSVKADQPPLERQQKLRSARAGGSSQGCSERVKALTVAGARRRSIPVGGSTPRISQSGPHRTCFFAPLGVSSPRPFTAQCPIRSAVPPLHDGSRVVDVVETHCGGEQKDESKHGPVDLAPRGLHILRGLSTHVDRKRQRGRSGGTTGSVCRHAPHYVLQSTPADAPDRQHSLGRACRIAHQIACPACRAW